MHNLYNRLSETILKGWLYFMGFFDKLGEKAGKTIAGILKGISSTVPEGETIFDLIKTDNNLKEPISYDSFKSINKVVQSLNSSVRKLKSSKTDCIKKFSKQYRDFSGYYKKNYSKFSVLDGKDIEFDPQNIREKEYFDNICKKLNQINSEIKIIKTKFSDSTKAKNIFNEIYKKIIDAIKKRNITDLENLSKEIDDKEFKEKIENIKVNLVVIEENSREKIDIKKHKILENEKKTIIDLNESINKLEKEIKYAREKDKAEKLETVKKEVLKLELEIKIKKGRLIKSEKRKYNVSNLFNRDDLFNKKLELEVLEKSLKAALTISISNDETIDGILQSNENTIRKFINNFYKKYNEYFTLKSKDLNEFNNKNTKDLLKKLELTNKNFEKLQTNIIKLQDELDKKAFKNIEDANKQILKTEASINEYISSLNCTESKLKLYCDLQSEIQKAYVAYINVLDNIISECNNRKSKISGAYQDFETIKSKIDNCLGVFDDSSIDGIKKKVKEIRKNKTQVEKLNSKITLGQVLSGVYYRMSVASEFANRKIQSYNAIIGEINKEKDYVDKAYKNTFSKYTGRTVELKKLNDEKKKKIIQDQFKNL